MAGAENFGKIAVIARALVFIGNVEGNGCSRGYALIHAGKQANGVGFLAFGRGGPLTGFATVKLCLDVGFRKGNARRAAVYNAAEANAVGFAKSRQAQGLTECVACHVTTSCGCRCARAAHSVAQYRQGGRSLQGVEDAWPHSMKKHVREPFEKAP